MQGKLNFAIPALLFFSFFRSYSQENYEIQVYGSQTTAKGSTMTELHSNFIFDGERSVVNGMYPTNHMCHETVEITHGFGKWFEIGIYFFNAIGDKGKSNYVGSHIRPRVMIPEDWNWPVGLSLSTEFGFQDKRYAEDDLNLEVRPIIDKKYKKLYVSLNPTLDRSFHGLNVNNGFIFSPNVKIAYDFIKKISFGFEYYGSTGPLTHFNPIPQQVHQLFAAADLISSGPWELNLGYGISFTKAADNSIFKLIAGYRF